MALLSADELAGYQEQIRIALRIENDEERRDAFWQECARFGRQHYRIDGRKGVVRVVIGDGIKLDYLPFDVIGTPAPADGDYDPVTQAFLVLADTEVAENEPYVVVVPIDEH